MIKILKHNWRFVEIDGKKTIKFKCPKCNIEQEIDHLVSELGVLSPSVMCGAECGFHDQVFLEDFDALEGEGKK